MNDKLKFNVDWLTIRVDGLKDTMQLAAEIFAEFPELDFFPRPSGGINFYKNALYVPQAGYSSIMLCWNEDENGNYLNQASYGTPHNTLVSITGDGCRFINDLKPDGLKIFCNIIAKHPYNVTRLDVNCDFLDSNNAIVPLIQLWASTVYNDFVKGELRFRCNMPLHTDKNGDLVVRTSVWDSVNKQETFNVTVGQRTSTKGVMQLYNKYEEMKKGRLSPIAKKTFEDYGVTDYWWRLEIRCKSFSNAVFQNLLKYGVHAAFLSALDHFGCFYVCQYKKDSEYDVIAIDWQAFLDEVSSFISEEADSIHLVEFVSQPYVPIDVLRTFSASDRFKTLFFKSILLGSLNPAWWNDLIRDARLKALQSERNIAFFSEVRNDYGFLPYPNVTITLPLVNQISDDQLVMDLGV